MLALAALALLAAPACDSARGADPQPAAGAMAAHPAAVPHHHAAAPPGEPRGEPTPHSIFHLESRWTDQHGEVRALGSLAGRVQVVTMVYTHCAFACPQLIVDMKRIEAQLAAEFPGRIGFVVVSIDPERDTPEQLRKFAEGVRLDTGRWTLLNGADADVMELAALLGVKFRRESPTDFAHSNVITVLDADGEVAFQQVGLGEDPAATVAAIRALLR
jgi:protein SCO1